MLLTLYGNSEIGAHSRSNLCHSICLKHFMRPRSDFLSFTHAQLSLSYQLVKVPWFVKGSIYRRPLIRIQLGPDFFDCSGSELNVVPTICLRSEGHRDFKCTDFSVPSGRRHVVLSVHKFLTHFIEVTK